MWSHIHMNTFYVQSSSLSSLEIHLVFCWDKHVEEHFIKVDTGERLRLMKERFAEAATGERMFC